MKPLSLIVFLLFCFQLEAQYPFDGINDQALNEYYTYWEDTSGTVSAEEVIAYQREFKKWNGGITFNKGIVDKVYWFYIPIKNTTNESQKALLRLSSKLDNVSLFELDESNHPSLNATSSSYIPYGDRPFPLRYICFPIELKAAQRKNFLLRVDNRGLGLYMPLSLMSMEKVLRSEQSRHWIYGIYFGLFFFIIFFCIFLYFSLRDKIHLWYSAYVASAILFMVQDEKFYTELYPDSVLFFFENAWVPPFSLLLMATSLRVMQLFVEQRKANSHFFRLTQFIMLLCFLLSGVMLSLSFLEPQLIIGPMRKLYIITDVLTAITILLIIVSVIEKIIQKQRLATYYLMAVMLMVLGSLNYFFNHLGITNSNVLKPNGVVVGLAFELTFLTLLLTVRYNNLKREKEKIRIEQKQIVANAAIQAQENERKRLAQDLHDDLGGTLSGLKLLTTNFFLQKNTIESWQLFQQQTLQLLDKAVSDIRDISHDLMPRDFNEMGIQQSVEELIYRLNQIQVIQFKFVFSGNEIRMTKVIQLSVFRIANELIQNTIRHSHASTATLQILIFEDTLHTQMEDDGIGIDSQKRNDGIGLGTIASRVEFMNGILNIDSGKAGTTINIEIPLPK